MDKLHRQRQYRLKNNNIVTKKYEKTLNGFVMRLYRNMKSRITGVQKQKAHLYLNKELLNKEDFYTWIKSNQNFVELFEKYKESNFDRKLAPTVDRINPNIGYVLNNMQILTHSENSSRSSKDRKNIPIIQYTLEGNELNRFKSLTEAIEKNNLPKNGQGNIYHCLKKRIKTAYGYIWKVDNQKVAEIRNVTL